MKPLLSNFSHLASRRTVLRLKYSSTKTPFNSQFIPFSTQGEVQPSSPPSQLIYFAHLRFPSNQIQKYAKSRSLCPRGRLGELQATGQRTPIDTCPDRASHRNLLLSTVPTKNGHTKQKIETLLGFLRFLMGGDCRLVVQAGETQLNDLCDLVEKTMIAIAIGYVQSTPSVAQAQISIKPPKLPPKSPKPPLPNPKPHPQPLTPTPTPHPPPKSATVAMLLEVVPVTPLQQLSFYYHLQIPKMSERKIWKAEQDLILKALYEEQGIKKWSEISKRMEKDYGIQGRNGKQCRERYHNHLKNGINKLKWSSEEEQRLVDLHASHGNRWALISKLIPGRTQNCVKNMLYSKLRKSLRQLNRFTYEHYRRQMKEIKISFIYRLIEMTECSYSKGEDERSEQEKMSINIKNSILRMEYDESGPIEGERKESLRRLMEEMHAFKRDNQRFRGQQGKGRKRERTHKEEIDQQQGEEEEEDAKGEDSFVDGEESQLAEGSLPERSIQTRQTMKDLQETTRELPEPPLPSKLRSKVSVMRMDSLQSNLSLLLVDRALQDPILLDNPFFTLTPTPTYKPNTDWTNYLSNWRPMASD